MKIVRNVLLIVGLAAIGAVPVMGQVHKYFSPGTVWTVTMIQMTSGMDQMYLQYLDTSFKKSEDAQVKAGFEKSYKILRTLDDSGTLNLLILREYASLAAIEANVEKADALSHQSDGTDEAQMQGYQRSIRNSTSSPASTVGVPVCDCADAKTPAATSDRTHTAITPTRKRIDMVPTSA